MWPKASQVCPFSGFFQQTGEHSENCEARMVCQNSLLAHSYRNETDGHHTEDSNDVLAGSNPALFKVGVCEPVNHAASHPFILDSLSWFLSLRNRIPHYTVWHKHLYNDQQEVISPGVMVTGDVTEGNRLRGGDEVEAGGYKLLLQECWWGKKRRWWGNGRLWCCDVVRNTYLVFFPSSWHRMLGISWVIGWEEHLIIRKHFSTIPEYMLIR